MYRSRVGIVPVQLVADDVLPGVVWLLPGEAKGGAPHLRRLQVARLARHTLLGLHLNKQNSV